MEASAMRIRLLLASAMLVLAVGFLIKTSLGAAQHRLLPMYGGSFGPIQILEVVDWQAPEQWKFSPRWRTGTASAFASFAGNSNILCSTTISGFVGG
jgi:hypothetical protein